MTTSPCVQPSELSSSSIAPVCGQYLQAMASLGVLVGDFYLLLGDPRPPRPLPKGIKAGQMRQCYVNAGRLAQSRPGWAYCEGFALTEGLFPMHHAWCLDETGRVVDPTWSHKAGNEYWGVALADKFVEDRRSETGIWDVLGTWLPPSMLEASPQTFLHERWLPAEPRLAEFRNKFAKVRSRVPV